MGDLVESVTAAVAALPLESQDHAAGVLAVQYATEIEANPDSLQKCGPALLSCLEALLMTPRARAAALRGRVEVPSGSATNPLDELRARRAQRTG